MEQLKMFWLAGTPIPQLVLPAECSVSFYQGPQDRLPWVECCKNGLVADDAGEENFINSIVKHRDTVAERDVMFLDYRGMHVGTITPIFHPQENIGEVHMVAVHRDFRGRGFGNILNIMALQKLKPHNPRLIYLTTDAWRKPAVKSYITAGFKPVLYMDDMLDRWKETLASLAILETDAVDSDGNIVTKIVTE